MLRPLTDFDGPVAVRPERFDDARGWFRETYNRAELAEHGVDADFVQDNESLSRAVGTLRGLHFQTAPHVQGKLIRVVRGAIADVAVDIRPGSRTFGDHYLEHLGADDGRQIWLPSGFAHGFCTLEPDTLVAYKVTAHYAPDAERTLRWDDPLLGIAWPTVADPGSLSAKDATAPGMEEIAAAKEPVR